jgi:hypothetical protein
VQEDEMSGTAAALERMLEPVGQALSPDVAKRILALRADAATQARLDELAALNASGTITVEDRDEYEALVGAGDLIAVLQAKARAQTVS